MNIKAFLLIFSIFITVTVFSTGLWTRKSDFGGGSVTRADGFSVGSYGYIIPGKDSTGFVNSLWQYDPASDSWGQMASFPGLARQNAVAFSIGGDGYYGTGNRDTILMNDFWSYNPASNIWQQKANFPGVPRFYAVGFSLGSKGCIGAGLSGLFATDALYDFFIYNPASDTWSAMPDHPVRKGPGVAFEINDKGYYGTGNDTMDAPTCDFWEFTESGGWVQKANLPRGKCAATGFSVNGKGYIGTGQDSTSGYSADFYEYDPILNNWTQKPDFGGGPRRHAVAIAIGNKGYAGTGSWGVNQDWWEYDPNGVGINEPSTSSHFRIFPNPAEDWIHIRSTCTGIFTIRIYNLQGDLLQTFHLNDADVSVNLSHLSSGVFLLELNTAGKSVYQKLLKK